MNKFERNIQELLHASGAILVRDKRHKIFRLEDGQNFVTASTPSSQGAARASLATLKRLSRMRPPAQSMVSIEDPKHTAPQRQSRVVIPNNPPRGRGEFSLSKSIGPYAKPFARVKKTKIFQSVVDVVMAADKSERFWELDPCGRIRALIHLTRNFARVEILPAIFSKASIEEVEVYEKGENMSGEEGLRQQAPLALRTLMRWGGSIENGFEGIAGVPSMLVHDPFLGTTLIEASAWSLLENTNYLFLWFGELKGTSYGIASQVWDAANPTEASSSSEIPDHYIYTYFITQGMAKRKGFKLQTCANWTDVAKTRGAVRQILEIGNEVRKSVST